MKKIIFLNVAVAGVIIGLARVFKYRLDKQIERDSAEMRKPLPPVGEEYIKRHQAMLNDPEFKRTNEIIDRAARDLGL